MLRSAHTAENLSALFLTAWAAVFTVTVIPAEYALRSSHFDRESLAGATPGVGVQRRTPVPASPKLVLRRAWKQ